MQNALIHLVGKLIDDDGLTRALVDVFKVGLCPHYAPAAARAIALTDALDAVDDACGGKVWSRNTFHQLIYGGFRRCEELQAGCHHFREVMGRNVGGHPHCNTR